MSFWITTARRATGEVARGAVKCLLSPGNQLASDFKAPYPTLLRQVQFVEHHSVVEDILRRILHRKKLSERKQPLSGPAKQK
jgi:hypothetical protein